MSSGSGNPVATFLVGRGAGVPARFREAAGVAGPPPGVADALAVADDVPMADWMVPFSTPPLAALKLARAELPAALARTPTSRRRALAASEFMWYANPRFTATPAAWCW